MSSLYIRPSIDASYQVSAHLAKQFQRRRFKKIANQKQESPVAAMFVPQTILVSDWLISKNLLL
jgi:hypothetical protein